MISKVILAPLGLMALAAATGCGAAATPEGGAGEEVAAPTAAVEQSTGTEQAPATGEAAKPGENTGRTQEPWMAFPGYGYGIGLATPYVGYGVTAYPYAGFAYPFAGLGYGALGYGGLGYGYGVGTAYGYSTGCINGLCY
jgi:hypothetical protein